MLNYNEIKRLNKSILNDHDLLSVDKIIITKESAELREKFNSGEYLRIVIH